MKYEREATKQRHHVITMAVAATRRKLTHVTGPSVHREVINSQCTQQTAILCCYKQHMSSVAALYCTCISTCLMNRCFLQHFNTPMEFTDTNSTFVGGLQQSDLVAHEE